MPKADGLKRWKTILGVVVLALTVLGMSLAGGRTIATALWGLEPAAAHSADVDALRSHHDADMHRIEGKLDCVLYLMAGVPASCSDQAMPR